MVMAMVERGVAGIGMVEMGMVMTGMVEMVMEGMGMGMEMEMARSAPTSERIGTRLNSCSRFWPFHP